MVAQRRQQPRLQVPLIGLRRSGKSSMLNVVYNDLHPDDTLFLESTLKAATVNSDSFLPITMTDMPGGVLLGASNRIEKGLPLTSSQARSAAAQAQARAGALAAAASPDPSSTATSQPATSTQTPAAPATSSQELLAWTGVSAVIFVIDAQDDYFEALSKLHSVILAAFAENQTIDFHVFIHKIDGYSEDYRQETLADIRGKVLDDLVDSSPSFTAQPWSYPAPVGVPKKDSGKSRSRSRDFGALGRSPALNGRAANGGAGSGAGSGSNNGAGYDASASEISLFSPGNNNGRSSGRDDSDIPMAGQINLESAVRLHFHLTSIFDTSVFVAFSKVQQSLMQKTKSVEAAPPPPRHLRPPSASGAGASGINRTPSPLAGASQLSSASTIPSTLAESVETLCDSICSSCKFDKAFLFDLPTRTFAGSDSTPFDAASFDVIFEYAGFLSKFASLYANVTPSCGDASTAAANGASSQPFPGAAALAPRRLATSVARLGPETSLAFWQINDRLSLITILKTDVHAKQSALIDYNLCFFQRAVVQLLDVVQSGI
ncbi:uncharacterized protein PFL1_04995 [Pseudozyma flocculosa PF-1]|uniref:Related to Ras-like G protein RagD n=2 Tax=Pseudozyma flocculosa TaxID=84751 RepID=A0A5C3EUX2_9BASI|nr:uncharacterized protein PFL1_04995 [Pseudozyma flocculosa PF-1]EPQ27457.1 hypothetical protein PFL1_04995 [Pseudozyma flocculosa PF-1]SPO36114.1 related to Ras-like G protein RagD [Pseudozyma flocculosa]